MRGSRAPDAPRARMRTRAGIWLARMTSAMEISQAKIPRFCRVQHVQERCGDTYVGFHRLVHWAPPDVLFRRVLLDDALIRGRTARLGS